MDILSYILGYKKGAKSGGDPVEVAVNLAMADGDQVIEPAEGQVMSKVTVGKPATLIPENIAEGVDIAGVIGSLVAGGGSDKTPVMKTGTFTAAAKTETVAHELGAVPDVAILLMSNTTTSTGIVIGCVGYGEALYNALGGGYINKAFVVTASGGMSMGGNNAIEGTSTNANKYGAFHNVTADAFTVGGNSYGLLSGAEYTYIFIGGLM